MLKGRQNVLEAIEYVQVGFGEIKFSKVVSVIEKLYN